MMRDPTIHVTRSNLKKLLMEMGMYEGDEMLVDDLVRDIFKGARPYQIRTRSGIVLAAKQRAKLSKRVQLIGAVTPEKINRMLYAQRIAHKHNFVRNITKADSEWTQLMALANDCHEFASMFKFSPLDEGFRQYIDIGLKLMGRKYGLSKFKYYKEKIFEKKAAWVIVQNDPDLDLTDLFENIWRSQFTKYSKAKPVATEDDRVHFVYARVECAEAEANMKDWIIAQFEGLSFMNVVPSLNQFYGDNALKRWKEYVLKRSKKKESDVVYDLPVTRTGSATDGYYEMLRTLKQTAE